MNSEYINSRLLFRYLNYISIFLFYSIGFLPFYVFGANMCIGTEDGIIADMKKITCATEDLQTAVQEDLLKRVAQLSYDASGDDPRDLVRGVESLSSSSQDLPERVNQFHEDRISAGKVPYTVDITAYPVNWKENSCSKKYKTIEATGKNYKSIKGRIPRSFDVHYTPVKGKTPRSFEVRYNSKKKKSFMCENTNLSDKQRERNYCNYSKGCKSACGGSEACENVCTESENCKNALFISCHQADKKGAVTTDKACLSLDDYNDLSKELFLGSGWFSFSNPALEKNCPDGCSYYTKTIQRVYKKQVEVKQQGSRTQKKKKKKVWKTCSDSYVIVHCGPKKEKTRFVNKEGEDERDYLYNLNIKKVTDLCADFDLGSGCSVF